MDFYDATNTIEAVEALRETILKAKENPTVKYYSTPEEPGVPVPVPVGTLLPIGRDGELEETTRQLYIGYIWHNEAGWGEDGPIVVEPDERETSGYGEIDSDLGRAWSAIEEERRLKEKRPDINTDIKAVNCDDHGYFAYWGEDDYVDSNEVADTHFRTSQNDPNRAPSYRVAELHCKLDALINGEPVRYAVARYRCGEEATLFNTEVARKIAHNEVTDWLVDFSYHSEIKKELSDKEIVVPADLFAEAKAAAAKGDNALADWVLEKYETFRDDVCAPLLAAFATKLNPEKVKAVSASEKPSAEKRGISGANGKLAAAKVEAERLNGERSGESETKKNSAPER